jgi:hypothetical protein
MNKENFDENCLTNIFPNVKTPQVISTAGISTVLNHIKVGTFKDKIIESRIYGKGHPIFEQNKTLTPTFTPNGTFTKRRSVGTIENLTGLIYLDIDHEIDVKKLHALQFVYSFWKSFSGNGYGLLVSVSGLKKDNFKSSWSYLSNYFLGLDITIDPHTKDISRQCVISYDPDIYINHNVVSLIIPEKSCSISDELFPITTTLPNYQSNITHLDKIKYQTTLDDYCNMDYIVIEEGREYRNTYIPQIIKEGARHTWLSSFTSSILFNNPDISCNKLEMILLKVNYEHCKPELSKDDVRKIVKWSFKKHRKQELMIRTKKKKIWLNPDKQLTLEQKKSIIGKETGKLRRKETLNRLIEIYKHLSIQYPRVTQKLLSENSSVKIRMVKNYWKEILYSIK